MSDYSVSEAKDNLPQLIREAEAGQEVRVTRRGLPVAVLLSAQKYDELKAGRPSFTERYQAFRQELEQDSVDLIPTRSSQASATSRREGSLPGEPRRRLMACHQGA